MVLNHRMSFFFNDTATTEIYTLSLHDALPISRRPASAVARSGPPERKARRRYCGSERFTSARATSMDLLRSEEHTSELQSRQYLVCRLLLEKKNKEQTTTPTSGFASSVKCIRS